MATLSIVVGATLAMSALCSLLEAALYSTRVPTLEAARSQGRHRLAAERFLVLKRDVAAPTSAILILNTLANTAGATVAGWLAAGALGPGMVPAFSVFLTISILLFSEILPKTYGATKWKSLWPWLALPLDLLVRGLRPAVWLSRKFSELFTGKAGATTVTEEEIRASIRMGAHAGELSDDQLQLLDSVFHFDDTTVREIMIPRDEVVYADLDAPAEAFARTLRTTPFTRYPACRGGLDQIVGVLHARDFAGRSVEELGELETMRRDVLRVPDTTSITRVLRQMQEHRRQIAVVVDELGSVAGIATLTDVLEQIVGGLSDELEPDDSPLQPQPDGSILVRGNLALSRINRELGLQLDDPEVVTLSGLVVRQLDRLPRRGDAVEIEGVTVEVLEVRGQRATRMRLRLPGAGD